MKGFKEEWLAENIPKIKSGKYTHVAFQVLRATSFLTAEDQIKLYDEIFPEVCKKVREAGAEPFLWDKHLDAFEYSLDGKNKYWTGVRYFDPDNDFFLLQQIWAAKKAGITKISFTGSAVNKLWLEPRWKEMKFIYEEGHPGGIGNYMYACNISYLLTGVSPVGNKIRKCYLHDGYLQKFDEEAQDFKDKYKSQVREKAYFLSEEEAKIVQEAVWASYQKWDKILKKNLADDTAFKATMDKVKRIHKTIDTFDKYGIKKYFVDGIKKGIFKRYPDLGLPKEEMDKILAAERKKDPMNFRRFIRKYFTPNERKVLTKKFHDYWQKNNSKFKTDIYPTFCIYSKLASTLPSEEQKRIKGVGLLFGEILSMPGILIAIEQLSEEQKNKATKGKNSSLLGGSRIRMWPTVSSALKGASWEKQVKIYNTVLKCLENPDLLDRWRNSNYSNEILKELDDAFKVKMTK